MSPGLIPFVDIQDGYAHQVRWAAFSWVSVISRFPSPNHTFPARQERKSDAPKQLVHQNTFWKKNLHCKTWTWRLRTGLIWWSMFSNKIVIQDCWKHVNVQKGFWPKLKKILETGCHGNAVVIAPNILPVLSKIPDNLFPNQERFLEDFFNCFRAGYVYRLMYKTSCHCNLWNLIRKTLLLKGL